MARPKGTSKRYHVRVPGGQVPLIERLVKLGLYGSTESEVVEKLAASQLEYLVVHKGILRTPLWDDSVTPSSASKNEKK